MDLEKLLRLLNEYKVKFLIIVAEAFPVYGWARATFDTDIFIEPTLQNGQKAMDALREFGYLSIDDLTLKQFLSKKTLFRQYILAVDIHPFVKGVKFKKVWQNKVRSRIGNVQVYFPSLSDIIKMKKAAGRPKDFEDLKYLTKIKQLKNKKDRQ
jgi:hypothetical protein